jgi:hypothetical protein
LNQLQQQQLDHSQQQQLEQEQQLQQQHDSEGGFRRVLLRLDHMRDRAGYTAIIKQWASELQLTGEAGQQYVLQSSSFVTRAPSGSLRAAGSAYVAGSCVEPCLIAGFACLNVAVAASYYD